MKARNLKIEASGDFWRGRVSPKIRLTGRWLERAGFKPGCRVEIKFIEPGKLTLQFLDQTGSSMMNLIPATRAGCGDILQGPAPVAAWLGQGVIELGQAKLHRNAQSPSELK